MTMNTNRVGDMTTDELRVLIYETVRDVLEEMTDDDPDTGLVFRPEIIEQLRAARRVKRRGKPLTDVADEFGLGNTPK